MISQNGQRVAVLSLGTAVPQYRATQAAVAEWLAASFKTQPVLGRWLKRVFAHAGVETRYACVPDFLQPPAHSRLAPGRPLAEALTTAERMAIYEREAVALGAAAGRRALATFCKTSNNDLAAVTGSITHLVVVSCTGFFAPGLDIALIRELNLAPTVQRTLVGFMGCAAAFNGLRTAWQTVRGEPSARILVVCVELGSIHIQPNPDRENLIAASLFADGASACLVGRPQGQGDIFEIGEFYTTLKPETESEMVWQIGNHGFILRLSPKIPQHLAEAAPEVLKNLLGSAARPHFWAIHPGGKAILDGLSTIFELEPEHLAASRSVLRGYGNLSSATIFFVLDELRHRLQQEGSIDKKVNGVAMAFGPGLTIEMAQLSYILPGAGESVQESPVELIPVKVKGFEIGVGEVKPWAA
jgi:predicted naringenin-chalcone synthase